MELTQYLDLNVKLFEMISTDGGSKNPGKNFRVVRSVAITYI